jgi:hypothetical protein
MHRSDTVSESAAGRVFEQDGAGDDGVVRLVFSPLNFIAEKWHRPRPTQQGGLGRFFFNYWGMHRANLVDTVLKASQELMC